MISIIARISATIIMPCEVPKIIGTGPIITTPPTFTLLFCCWLALNNVYKKRSIKPASIRMIPIKAI